MPAGCIGAISTNGRLRSATTGGADVKTVLSGLDSPRAVSVLALAGDYNRDGIVDAADYTVWRDGLGSKYTQTDYTVWKSNFGNHAGSGAGAEENASVPEPATILLLGLAMPALFMANRRSHLSLCPPRRSLNEKLRGKLGLPRSIRS